jgi:hypothetical protein
MALRKRSLPASDCPMILAGSAVQMKGLELSLASRGKAIRGGLKIDERAEHAAPVARSACEEALAF